MSVRRDTTNRLTLLRQCAICGKNIVTTVDTPWIRQMYNVDGKKQKTCYFCSEQCSRSSYKHIGWYDGKAEQRRAAREAKRDRSEYNRAYYTAHREQERERARRRYWEHREEALESARYNRKKRRLLEGKIENG